MSKLVNPVAVDEAPGAGADGLEQGGVESAHLEWPKRVGNLIAYKAGFIWYRNEGLSDRRVHNELTEIRFGQRPIGWTSGKKNKTQTKPKTSMPPITAMPSGAVWTSTFCQAKGHGDHASYHRQTSHQNRPQPGRCGRRAVASHSLRVFFDPAALVTKSTTLAMATPIAIIMPT